MLTSVGNHSRHFLGPQVATFPQFRMIINIYIGGEHVRDFLGGGVCGVVKYCAVE